jgi:hypothetical protein
MKTKPIAVGALVGIVLSCGPAAVANTHTATKPTPTTKAATATKPKAPLGDLSKFRKITVDTLALAKAGDLKKAEKRITDMETKWDAYENALKSKDSARWTQLDGALDKVLKALRASKPDAATSTKLLEDMLALIDFYA